MKLTMADIGNLIRALELSETFMESVRRADRLPIAKGEWSDADLQIDEERCAEIKRFRDLRRRLLRAEAKR